MPPKARKTLTLEERVKVINLSSSGKSCKKIAEELGVGKTCKYAQFISSLYFYNFMCFLSTTVCTPVYSLL